MVLIHMLASIITAAITSIISYVIFRKRAVASWGWFASFFPDMPVFWLVPLGVTGLGNVLILSHTAGIFVFPLLLMIIDILLIELAWLRCICWLPYPRFMRKVKKIDYWADTLEKYNAIPRPIRVTRVYIVGVMAGLIHLGFNLLIGFL